MSKKRNIAGFRTEMNSRIAEFDTYINASKAFLFYLPKVSDGLYPIHRLGMKGM